MGLEMPLGTGCAICSNSTEERLDGFICVVETLALFGVVFSMAGSLVAGYVHFSKLML